MDAKKSSPRQLWHSVDVLLGRGHVPLLDAITPSSFTATSMTRSPAFDLPWPALLHRSFGRYLALRRSKISSQLMVW